MFDAAFHSAEAVLSAAQEQHPDGPEGRALRTALLQVQAACKKQDKKLGAKLAAAFQ